MRGRDGFLLVARETRQAVRKGVGDTEIHAYASGYRLNSGMARTMNSSNSGTVNAMSPCAGL
jgi:hypothetical protein